MFPPEKTGIVEVGGLAGDPLQFAYVIVIVPVNRLPEDRRGGSVESGTGAAAVKLTEMPAI